MNKYQMPKKMWVRVIVGALILLFLAFSVFYGYYWITLQVARKEAEKRNILLSESQINSAYGRKNDSSLLQQKYDEIMKLYIFPAKEDSSIIHVNFGLTEALYGDRQPTERQRIGIKGFVESNEKFLAAYEQLQGLENLRFFDNVRNVDYEKVLSYALNALRTSNLYDIKTENDILLNLPDEIVKNISRISNADNFAQNMPFKVSNDLFRSNTETLIRSINRAVNNVEFNNEQLNDFVNILINRRKKLDANIVLTLMGINSEFLLDANRNLPTASDYFWSQTGEGKTVRPVSKTNSRSPYKAKINMLNKIIAVYDLLEKPNSGFSSENNKFFAEERKNFPENFYSERFFKDNLFTMKKLHTNALIIAATLYKRKTGKYPENVEVLIDHNFIPGHMTVNPYNGELLKLKIMENAEGKNILTVYSDEAEKGNANYVIPKKR